MAKVKNDPTLLAEIRKYGKFDTNACFQCGSCTVTCDLTDNSASFPRRIVRYALLGLRKLLLRKRARQEKSKKSTNLPVTQENCVLT